MHATMRYSPTKVCGPCARSGYEEEPSNHQADLFLGMRDQVEQVFNHVGCEYHLIPQFKGQPATVPALTATGFVEWLEAFALGAPDQEAARLHKIVEHLPIEAEGTAVDGPSERLPKQLSRHLFPSKPSLPHRQRLLEAAANVLSRRDRRLERSRYGEPPHSPLRSELAQSPLDAPRMVLFRAPSYHPVVSERKKDTIGDTSRKYVPGHGTLMPGHERALSVPSPDGHSERPHAEGRSSSREVHWHRESRSPSPRARERRRKRDSSPSRRPSSPPSARRQHRNSMPSETTRHSSFRERLGYHLHPRDAEMPRRQSEEQQRRYSQEEPRRRHYEYERRYYPYTSLNGSRRNSLESTPRSSFDSDRCMRIRSRPEPTAEKLARQSSRVDTERRRS